MTAPDFPYIYRRGGKWYFRGGGVLPDHPSQCEKSLALYSRLHQIHIKGVPNKWREAAEMIDGPTPLLDYFASISDAKAQRFENMILRKRGKDACWPWRGKPDRLGYGTKHIATLGRSVGAHRASIAYFNAVEPGDQFVCHHCDNPICCRPDHLYLGDAQTNATDRVVRERVNPAFGPRAPSAKLTQEQAEHLRELFGQGASPRSLARMFSVSESTVSKIGRGLSYRPSPPFAA